jgi:hypothetical protein
MAAFTDELVDPQITDVHGEEVVAIERNFIDKMKGMASQVSHKLMNRSAVPDAMPDEQPVPFSDGRFHRQIGQAPGPREQGYGPVRQGRGIGLDGETFKFVVGSVASASSSAASASSSAAAAVGSAAVQYVQTTGKDNVIHNVKVVSGATVSGAGVVFNVAAGTAMAAASGTGAVLNFAADSAQHLMPAALTEDQYRQMQAHEARVVKDNAIMGALARLHGNALKVQEERRVSEDAENKRKAEEAMAKAQQQELDFQDARSAASAIVRVKHGDGRRGNVSRALQGRQPATEQHVRMEKEDGIGAKLARGGAKLMKGVDRLFMPSQLYQQMYP